MNYTLELVVVPVSDVDRAKAFYIDNAGFELHVDHRAGDDFRVVQLNPPGSACSIAIGTGISSAEPGSTKGLHLMVTDIVAARDELVARGVDVSAVRHMGGSGWVDGPHPERTDYNTFAEFTDPDGNLWLLQERGYSAG
jgi:catechol 2,3-dioxygenase-like lactoylglutathione lyase family enzyme